MLTAIIFFVIVGVAITNGLIHPLMQFVITAVVQMLKGFRAGNFQTAKNPALKKPGSNKFTLVKSISEECRLFYQQFLPHRDRLQFFYQQLLFQQRE